MLCQGVDFDFRIGGDDTVTLLAADRLTVLSTTGPLGDDGAENQTTVRRNDGSYGYTQAPTPGGGGESPCLTALARAGGPRHYLGAASRCADIRDGAALPSGAVPPFGTAFDAPVDAGAACASAYARVEEGGEPTRRFNCSLHRRRVHVSGRPACRPRRCALGYVLRSARRTR